MKKYQILPATIFIALLWMGLIYLVDDMFINQMFSILIYVDATTMAILLVGVTMFFEKQEGTFRSLLVSPIHKRDYILSKGISNIFSNFVTLFLLFAFALWVKDVEISIVNYLWAVALIGFFHTMLGFLISFYSKDFNSLLMRMMVYAFICVLPVVFEAIGFIDNEIFSKILYAIPTKASMLLLNHAAQLPIETWELYFSVGYLAVASIVFFFVVMKEFDKYAQREGGN